MEAFVYRAKVLKVVDGDTIDVDIDLGFDMWYKNQSVRLAGIDTPESRTTDKEERIRGLLSKQKVLELCPKDSIIVVKTEIGKEKEKFGRILGTVVNGDGVNINQYLIENNYAVAYEGKSKELIQEAHQKNAELLKQRGEL